MDTQRIDAEPRRSLRIQSYKKLCRHEIPELPPDIMVNIISRLPLKLIVACKFLFKDFRNLITGPSFSHLYQTNKPYSLLIIFVDIVNPQISFVEFQERDFRNKKRKLRKHTIFNIGKLPGAGVSIWGNCNGLLCALKYELGAHNLFVINPLLDQFIQLPDPVVYGKDKSIFFAYGMGYCQFTNRYKVLRIVTEWLGGANCRSDSDIFTIGSDQNWRSVSDGNVPFNLIWGCDGLNPQSPMVPFRSSLHWIVQPTMLFQATTMLLSTWGDGIYICAFDMTEEKAIALPLPPGVDVANLPLIDALSVLFDKLSMLLIRIFGCIELWVMDEYGVEGSWRKLYVLNSSTIPDTFEYLSMMPLTVSPEGVIVVSDCYQLLLYDLEKEKCLKSIVPQKDVESYPFHFVPSFTSLGHLLQG